MMKVTLNNMKFESPASSLLQYLSAALWIKKGAKPDLYKAENFDVIVWWAYTKPVEGTLLSSLWYSMLRRPSGCLDTNSILGLDSHFARNRTLKGRLRAAQIYLAANSRSCSLSSRNCWKSILLHDDDTASITRNNSGSSDTRPDTGKGKMIEIQLNGHNEYIRHQLLSPYLFENANCSLMSCGLLL